MVISKEFRKIEGDAIVKLRQPLAEPVSRQAYFRQMLLDGKVDELADIIRADRSTLTSITAFYHDSNSVIMVRAAEAIQKATQK